MGEFKLAVEINHPGLRGKIREIALNNIIKPLLPDNFEVGNGTVIDYVGNQTSEIDLVIHSKSILPAVMISDREGFFPSEASFYAIEVKSRLTSEELRDTVNKAQTIKRLQYTSGKYTVDDMAISHNIIALIPVLFAFSSDLSADGTTEIERYMRIDQEAKKSPSLAAICVVGSGYWYFNANRTEWIYYPPSEDYEEVIRFISGILNTLPKTLLSRAHPRLGLYLVDSE